MDEYLLSNQHLWNKWAHLHEKSPAYKLAEFKAGNSTLQFIERNELNNVAGKTLLHLQCHFGLDTLSWAREGAIVTGVDFSNDSIDLARSLSSELKIPANFILSELLDLPKILTGQFDIVFTSYGVLSWLRDLKAWASVIAYFLKPNGVFYIAEFHPFSRILTSDSPELKVANQYFFSEEPLHFEIKGSYATESDDLSHGYHWYHSLGEILNALIGAGLQIEFFNEFPFTFYERFSGMIQDETGLWRLKQQDGIVPLMFSLQARKMD